MQDLICTEDLNIEDMTLERVVDFAELANWVFKANSLPSTSLTIDLICKSKVEQEFSPTITGVLFTISCYWRLQ